MQTTELETKDLPLWAQKALATELNGISDVCRIVIQCPEYSDVEIFTCYVYADQDWIIALKNNTNYTDWISVKVFQL